MLLGNSEVIDGRVGSSFPASQHRQDCTEESVRNQRLAGGPETRVLFTWTDNVLKYSAWLLNGIVIHLPIAIYGITL